MIWARWRDPNRRVRAVDPDGQTARVWITLAPDDSDQQLRERLEDRGYSDIHVSGYDFQTWKNRARTAAEAAAGDIRAGRTPRWDENLYRQLKQHLFDLSNNRCAYCEAKVKHIDYGDVEHYRPKTAVREDRQHHGYYWLAYEPTNLLPSCSQCNQPPGKHNQFPVQTGTRAVGPEDSLVNERPLLLNPYLDDPLQHLTFLCTGDVAGKTERGEETIRICRLRRLREDRLDAMQQLKRTLSIRQMACHGDIGKAVTSLIKDLCQGQDEYCNALLGHLLYLVEEEEKRLAQARLDVQAAINPPAGGGAGS